MVNFPLQTIADAVRVPEMFAPVLCIGARLRQNDVVRYRQISCKPVVSLVQAGLPLREVCVEMWNGTCIAHYSAE